jgi:protein O-mannosyl-transferase
VHQTTFSVQPDEPPAAHEHAVEASLANQASTAAALRLGALTGNLRVSVLVGVSLLALGTYYNCLYGGFVRDDRSLILENPMMGKWNTETLKVAFTRDSWANLEPEIARDKIDSVYYRPIFLLALMSGHSLAGTNAIEWHLIAVCLHLLAAFLAFLAIDKMLALTTAETGGSRTLMSAFATAIFLVHPVQSESVAWISGLVGPLSTFFVLGAFICYLAYRRTAAASALIGAALLFLIATFTKEQTLVLPIVILACEFIAFRTQETAKPWQRGRIVLITMMGMIVVYLAARYAAIGTLLGRNQNLNFPDDASLTFADQLRTLPALLLQYCKLVVYPSDLSLMYAFGYVRKLSVPGFWLPLTAVSVIATLLIYGARRWQTAAIGAVWLVIPLLPHLNTRAFVSDEIIHDRYLYGSLIGVGIVTAFVVWRVSAHPAIRGSLAGLVLLALAALTVNQNRQWKTDESLWTRAAQTAPDSRIVHLALAGLAEKRHQPATALTEYELVLKAHPDVIDALNNSALLSGRTGRWREAAEKFERIVELTPDKAIAHFNLSFVYAVQKRYGDAAREQRTAIELDPNGPLADEWRSRLEQIETAMAAAPTSNSKPK